MNYRFLVNFILLLLHCIYLSELQASKSDLHLVQENEKQTLSTNNVVPRTEKINKTIILNEKAHTAEDFQKEKYDRLLEKYNFTNRICLELYEQNQQFTNELLNQKKIQNWLDHEYQNLLTKLTTQERAQNLLRDQYNRLSYENIFTTANNNYLINQYNSLRDLHTNLQQQYKDLLEKSQNFSQK